MVRYAFPHVSYCAVDLVYYELSYPPPPKFSAWDAQRMSFLVGQIIDQPPLDFEGRVMPRLIYDLFKDLVGCVTIPTESLKVGTTFAANRPLPLERRRWLSRFGHGNCDITLFSPCGSWILSHQ